MAESQPAPTAPATEEWRPVPPMPRYEVSSQGRVRCACTRRVKRTFLSPDGYPRVTLYLNAHTRARVFDVHRLVAWAFLGTPADGQQVDHRDSDRTNNHAENLHYVTARENQQLTTTRGRRRRGRQVTGARLTHEEVLAIRADLRPQQAIADHYGVARSTISAIKRRENWSWM